MSLWRALWTGFGWPYISLGLLKLFSDALNFAGAQSAQAQRQESSVRIQDTLYNDQILHLQRAWEG